MDLTSELLKGCSPYICSFIYNELENNLVIELYGNPENQQKPSKRIVFSNISNYSETLNDDYDETCLDDIVGINMTKNNKICINTQNRDVIFTTREKPITEDI